MTITGSCSCGKVRLAISGEAKNVRECWCRQCQKTAGGGPILNAIFLTDDVQLDGELAASGWTAHSGNEVTSYRCAACGDPVYVQGARHPHFMAIRLGVLDVGHGLSPQMIFWTEEAPGWAVLNPALPQYARQPEPRSPARRDG